ncbi:MAG: adenosine kinase [Acetobacterales bacterium]
MTDRNASPRGNDALDVIAIGNAIVDVLANADDDFLTKQGLDKGGMTLIDAERAESLYDAMGPGIECSGGSAANTAVGVASLGGRVAFVGKVRDDHLGGIFRHDIRAAGVAFETPPTTDGLATARCLVMVSPDAERTMGTFLGACQELGPDDIDADQIRAARTIFLEGYLWDPPGGKAAFRRAAEIAQEADTTVALTLSDAHCVERHREDFLDLIDGHVDVLFANEAEVKALFEVDDFDEAMQRVRSICGIAALTRSEKGSVVVNGSEVHVVEAAKVDKVVDVTGAGDLYAAGFLYGLSRGLPLADCARVGGLAAAEVISHIGARPQKTLAELLPAEHR